MITTKGHTTMEWLKWHKRKRNARATATATTTKIAIRKKMALNSLWLTFENSMRLCHFGQILQSSVPRYLATTVFRIVQIAWSIYTRTNDAFEHTHTHTVSLRTRISNYFCRLIINFFDWFLFRSRFEFVSFVSRAHHWMRLLMIIIIFIFVGLSSVWIRPFPFRWLRQQQRLQYSMRMKRKCFS